MTCEKHQRVSKFLNELQQEVLGVQFAHYLRDDRKMKEKLLWVQSKCCDLQVILDELEYGN